MRGNIDIVELLNPAGIAVVITGIHQHKDVEKAAQHLTRYHGDRYTVRIKNVPAHLYPNQTTGHSVDLARYLP